MATAYASLRSLMSVLTRIQHASCPIFLGDKSQIKSFCEKTSRLIGLLEKYSDGTDQEVERFEIEIKIVKSACGSEDLIERYVREQIVEDKRSDEKYVDFCNSLHRMVNEMDSIETKVMELTKQQSLVPVPSLMPSSPITLVSSSPMDKNLVVGIKEEVDHLVVGIKEEVDHLVVGIKKEVDNLVRRLNAGESCLEIIPIVGMGGIGKTTLARCVLKESRRFKNMRALATISQNYSVIQVIISLLSKFGVKVDSSQKDQEDLLSLEEIIRTKLSSKKYLIVLDDLWSVDERFDDLLKCFPDENKGSRILITTRSLQVARTEWFNEHYEMKFLNNHESWELFSNIVFGGGNCIPELEDIGKTIINSCKGLPLAIVVISGLLKKTPQDRNRWQKIAKNVSSITNLSEEKRCLEILSLSYSNLPIHLKPCFLYMSGYREDSEIYVPKLVKLWACDGFLKPDGNKTLEEVALQYVNDLCDRNLIIAIRRGSSGKTKKCIMHDLIRDLCLKEANKQSFLFVLHKETQLNLSDLQDERRILCQKDSGETLYMPPNSLARSLICETNVGARVIGNCPFLRVVDTIKTKRPFKSVQQLVSMRYFSIFFNNSEVRSAFGTSISKLWNLETLNISVTDYRNVSLPSEVWELPHLKHLMFSKPLVVKEPAAAQIDCIRNDLQSLGGIDGLNFTAKFTTKFPNLRKLKLSYKWKEVSELQCLDNLASLKKLEVLECSFCDSLEITIPPFFRFPCLFSKNFKFPCSLRKLTLGGSNIPWDNTEIVRSLVNLEVLVLHDQAFLNSEWNLPKVEFGRLKYLRIDASITKLEANRSHFPKLEHLIIVSLKLKEISWGIGEIETLQSIQLLSSLELSAVKSAKAIYEERIRKSGKNNNEFVIEVGVCADKVWDEVHDWGYDMFRVRKGKL